MYKNIMCIRLFSDMITSQNGMAVCRRVGTVDDVFQGGGCRLLRCIMSLTS